MVEVSFELSRKKELVVVGTNDCFYSIVIDNTIGVQNCAVTFLMITGKLTKGEGLVTKEIFFNE